LATLRRIEISLRAQFLRGAAQQSIPVAIAVPDMAAAERGGRAVIKLVVDAAMVGAVRPPSPALVGAMVAEWRRQRRRRLPVGSDQRTASRPINQFTGGAARYRRRTS